MRAQYKRVHLIRKGAYALRKCRMYDTQNKAGRNLFYPIKNQMKEEEEEKKTPKKRGNKIYFILYSIFFSLFIVRVFPSRSQYFSRSFSCTHTHTHTPYAVYHLLPRVHVCAHSFNSFFLLQILLPQTL